MKGPTIIIMFLLFVLAACQQEKLPEDCLEDAEIYFFGKANGESILMIAGEDSLYNYTPYNENEHHIFELTSTLAHLKSPLNKRYLEIKIWDSQSTESSVDPKDRFKNGDRDFLLNSEYIESNDFRMVPNFDDVPVDQYHWELGSYGVSQALHPEPTLKSVGSEWICLKGITIRGDTLSTCKQVSVTNPELYTPDLRIVERSSEYVTLSATIEGTSPDTWIWDGSVSSENTFKIYSVDISATDIHRLSILKHGKVIYDSHFLLDTINGQLSIAQLDFSTMKEKVNYADIRQTGKVVMNYFVPGQGLFSSRFMGEGSEGSFLIEQNGYFRQNEEGIPTHKLSLRFDVPLESEMGDTIRLSTGGSLMAFPNP